MMKWKKRIKRLLFPPVPLVLLLTLVSAAGLIWVFVGGLSGSVISYVIYCLSFYSLTVFCLTLPRGYRKAKGKAYENPYGNRYLTDPVFRTQVSLYLSMGVNAFYVAVNGVHGVLSRSSWFITLAAYYFVLVGMRFLLFYRIKREDVGKNRIRELQKYRLCGCILMGMNLILAGMVALVVYRGFGFQYSGLLIYAMAAYTFYITILSVVNLKKYKKYNSPILSAAKTINLSSALVSMLALETAMLAQFSGDNSENYNRILTGMTGTIVLVIVLAMASYMIIKSTRELKASRSQE